jgi:hypothetical protein
MRVILRNGSLPVANKLFVSGSTFKQLVQIHFQWRELFESFSAWRALRPARQYTGASAPQDLICYGCDCSSLAVGYRILFCL